MHSCPPVLSNKPPLTSFGQELAKSMTSHLLSDSLINPLLPTSATPNHPSNPASMGNIPRGAT